MGNSDTFKYEYKNNKYYKRYQIQRDKIREKHNILEGRKFTPGPQLNYDYTEEERKKFRAYLKDIGDLLYKKDGWFQKFIWDDMSELEKELQSRKARGRLNGPKYLL